MFLKKHLTTLLPRAVSATAPPAIDWNLLVATGPQREGEARFETQLLAVELRSSRALHAGVTGHGQVPHTRRRHRALESHNRRRLDRQRHPVACLEGAVMGGILAARAVAASSSNRGRDAERFDLRSALIASFRSFVAHYGEQRRWNSAGC